jgi:hypothetical protein
MPLLRFSAYVDGLGADDMLGSLYIGGAQSQSPSHACVAVAL